jgi:hypothetical protein
VSDIPEEVRDLADRRELARRNRDFDAADALRQDIRRAGFDVTDTPAGPILTPGRPPASSRSPGQGLGAVRRSEDVEGLLDSPPIHDASVQWVVEGWPEDVARGVASFRRHQRHRSIQHVVVDAAGFDHDLLPMDVDVVPVLPEAGWAVARNAGLRRATGSIVVVVDGSTEAVGDVIGPLIEALGDRRVGVTGPFGIESHDLREFHESPGPEVDAVEGYLMAFRRELVEAGLRFDEKFRFYRAADIDLSFQVKARGFRATVTPLPVIRHEHRLWAATSEEERARLSKRNFYRFLDRWRGRTDLLVSRDA